MTGRRNRAESFSQIPECYKDIVNPEWGLSLRQMNEICDEMEATIEKIEKEREAKSAAPDTGEVGSDEAP
jgi:hypothetical protein